MNTTTLPIILLLFTSLLLLVQCQLFPLPTSCSALCAPININRTAECGCHLFVTRYAVTRGAINNATIYQRAARGPCNMAFGRNPVRWTTACRSLFLRSGRDPLNSLSNQMSLSRNLVGIDKQCAIPRGPLPVSRMFSSAYVGNMLLTNRESIPIASRRYSLIHCAFKAFCYIIYELLHLDPTGPCKC